MSDKLDQTQDLSADENYHTIDHRCGHSDYHFVAVADRDGYIKWLQNHDCGLCALSDLQDGVVLDKPLPPLLGDDLTMVKRMEIFRVEVLADLVGVCQTDQRHLGEHFAKWDVALAALARRRVAMWWADLWTDPGFQARYLIEQFANGTPRHPQFPRPGASQLGTVISPVLYEPYDALDFLETLDGEAIRRAVPNFEADDIDFEDVHGALLKDLREAWEMVKAGRGNESPGPHANPSWATSYIEMVEYRIAVLEFEFEHIRDVLAEF